MGSSRSRWMERQKILDEYEELMAKIADLKDILDRPDFQEVAWTAEDVGHADEAGHVEFVWPQLSQLAFGTQWYLVR